MNLPKVVVTFLLLLAAVVSAVPQNNAEQEVRKLEREWLDAYERRDAQAMDEIVADDFMITFPDGSTQTKPQIIAALQAAKNAGGVSYKFYTENVRVRVYGETVILAGLVTTERQRDGTTVKKEQSRYTDTYVKRDGRWQVVASHLSNAPPARQQTSTISYNAGQGRSLHKNRLVSLKNPIIVIDVDEQLTSLGILNFPLKSVAQVERYIFVRADEDKRLQRLFIVQLEAILPEAKGGYTFQVTNPTRIGNYDYQTDVGFFNFAERIAASPGAEAEKTKAYLDSNGLRADDDFLVARYARIASAEKRHELIFFYLENLRDLGLTRAELAPGGARAAESEKVFRDFAARAARSFKVRDGKS